jgi:hypothetical protein
MLDVDLYIIYIIIILMDTFLKNNHIVIMTIAITNLLLCLMPPYNH